MSQLQPSPPAMPPLAVLMHDMLAAGVVWEMGEQAFPWVGKPPEPFVRPSQPQQVPPAILPVGQPMALQPSPLTNKPRVPMARMGPMPLSAASVWTVGEGGGLVVMARGMPHQAGQVPMEAAELDLLGKMLAAVQAGPIAGWVVLGSREDKPRPEQQQALQQALHTLAPTRVLVLGEAVLGTWVGTETRILAWQSVGTLPDLHKPVGATLPPSVLLKQPLFKQHAWQHLLAWKQKWEAVS